MAVPPAAMDPQVIVVMLVVQLLSENTPMLGDVAMVPDEETFWLTVMAARVVATSDSAAIVRAIAVSFEALTNAMMVLLHNSHIYQDLINII